MKKILILLFIGVMSIPMNGQTKEDIKKDYTGPVFEFETKVIDYGEIAANSDGNRVFKFKNIGKSPLIISKVKGSCGCTVPTKPEEPIMPGETGEIGVKYATNRIGPFSKTITISSNAYEPQVVLKIKGRVLEEGSGDLQKKKAIVSESN
ncbi:DUF1573 domain-containing protein [Lutimonas saemankumensis]|uniref:DUF1573 domain-containing protein n=1 Tax=Lutimonas saemankumensis TaxID=483016 RepID=UPI001CD6D64E|nr:DUF1573 domain-containing protein [Lutimonas saemankumensis]MCA0932265.1 DUF1573 domain-containing protein [Lutimonas saemankumensis]